MWDTAGNVWQWTADVYAEPRDAATLAHDSRRVIEDGSFLFHVDYCEGYRPSARRGTPRDAGYSHVGFRCARDG